MTTTDEKYLTVKEASETLGIAPNTLRSWGAAGKIDEYRHPVNNYRLYLLSDVISLKNLLSKPIKQTKSTKRN